jgi:hypothetical protein
MGCEAPSYRSCRHPDTAREDIPEQAAATPAPMITEARLPQRQPGMQAPDPLRTERANTPS